MKNRTIRAGVSRAFSSCQRASTIEGLEPRRLLASIVVNGTGDTVALNGVVTLAEAIQSANSNSDVNADVTAARTGSYNVGAGNGVDTINFNIAGAGVHTIAPDSPLPEIIDPVFINGYSQPGSSANTLAVGNDAKILIAIDGSNANTGFGASGLILGLNSDGSTIRGLSVGNCGASGIAIIDCTQITIAGNFLGVAPDGTTAAPSTFEGVIVNSDGNTIGGTTPADRNVISGNFDSGIVLGSGASHTKIQGNYIGTNAAGTAALGNAVNGIEIQSKNNTIGGSTAGAGNLISGNTEDGILIDGAQATGNTIAGNFIGTNASGTAAISNGGAGVQIKSPGNTVGGTTVGARNIISGNLEGGVELEGDDNAGDDLSGTVVQGNYIGTDVTGTAAIANQEGVGIFNDAKSPYVLIGGTAAGAGNLISGNLFNGIGASHSGAVIQGNIIGLNASQTAALGNGSNGIGAGETGLKIGGTAAGAGNVISGNGGAGVYIGNASADLQGNYIGTNASGANFGNTGSGIHFEDGAGTVGGTIPQAGNVIAFNHEGGIVVVAGSQAEIRLNSIFSNVGLGIDLTTTGDGDGVTINDPGDSDTGGNGLQNYPLLGSAVSGNGSTTIQGAINSTANTLLTLDFYSDTPNLPAQAEGKQYIGSYVVLTDSHGNATFTATFGTSIAAGQFVTATATNTVDPYNPETSEFSQPIAVQAPPPPPPAISISDASNNEGNSGTTAFTFTVTRTGDTSGTSDLYYKTVDGSATSPTDYTAVALTPLHFAANETSKQITVQVKGDTTIESNEAFYVKLSSPIGATISDDSGQGTIVNDDLPPAPSAVGYTNLKASKGKNNRYTYGDVVASFTSTVFNSASNFTANIDWGDGQTSAGSISWNKKTKRWDVSGLHQYVNRGTYHLVITITDANGRIATANSTLTA